MTLGFSDFGKYRHIGTIPQMGPRQTCCSRRSRGPNRCQQTVPLVLRPLCGVGVVLMDVRNRKTTDARRSSQSLIICALEAFEIPGERHSGLILGRSWWRGPRDPDMTDVLHDGRAAMTNSADTTIRALDHQGLRRSGDPEEPGLRCVQRRGNVPPPLDGDNRPVGPVCA